MTTLNRHFPRVITFVLYMSNLAVGQPVWKTIPQDVCSDIDGKVTLICALDGLDGVTLPSWSQEHPTQRTVTEGTNVSPSCSTCAVSYNVERGEYNLTIDPVSENDEGVWRCTTTNANPQFYEATLTKLEPCDRSVIVVEGASSSSGNTHTIEENHVLELNCSQIGCPAVCASFIWYNGSHDNVIQNGGNTFSLNISSHHNGSRIGCIVSETAQNDWIELNVLYAPKNVETMIIKQECPHLVECFADANPVPQYSWPHIQQSSSKANIERQQEYYCSASNEFGVASSTLQNMTYCYTEGDVAAICCTCIIIEGIIVGLSVFYILKMGFATIPVIVMVLVCSVVVQTIIIVFVILKETEGVEVWEGILVSLACVAVILVVMGAGAVVLKKKMKKTGVKTSK